MACLRRGRPAGGAPWESFWGLLFHIWDCVTPPGHSPLRLAPCLTSDPSWDSGFNAVAELENAWGPGWLLRLLEQCTEHWVRSQQS